MQVVMVGIPDPDIAGDIPEGIQIMPPVSNSEHPYILKEADILGLFYQDPSYMRGVIPAKFFECLATGKPLLVSGLASEEIAPYQDVIYDVEGSVKKLLGVITKLPETETEECLRRRKKIAMEADWDNRFNMFVKCLE